MTGTQSGTAEIQPHEYMTKLGPRLRVNHNKERGRYVATFSGVYELLGSNTKQNVMGLGLTEMEACRDLALKMKNLHGLGRLQVLESGAEQGPEKVVFNNFTCNGWTR